MVEKGGKSAFLAADITRTTGLEQLLIPELHKVDILKVGHHGSTKSVTANLLAELSPSVAVIPVGENSYGHPSADTLELLAVSGSKICRTDDCGAITCRLSADGSVKLSTYLSSEDANELE